MKRALVIKELTKVMVQFRDDLNFPPQAIAEYLYEHLMSLYKISDTIIVKKEEFVEELPLIVEEKPKDDGVNEFIDRMYALYPTKCPKRNTSLGKSMKDKARIKALLKTYTKEQIEQVIRNEVDSNYGVNYMKNFSTFLNNFPEPQSVVETVQIHPITHDSDKLIINGVEYK
jgi:hypothetical protein